MLRRFWLKLFRRRSLERDLQAELEFHRAMAQASGNPIPLGNRAVIEEQAFDLWRFTRVENLWRDVRFAARGLRRSPALLLGALVSLGLGIGANTALFSLAAEFLLSEPSVSDAGSLVSVRLGGNSHASPETVEFVRRSGIFAGLTGEQSEAYANWNDGYETRRIFSTVTARNFFTVLGVPMALGRGYNDQDSDEVVVLHNHFWWSRFNADPSIVGRAIVLDGKPYTVLGVLPESHRTLTGFGFAPDVYMPSYLKTGLLAMYARLKPGQSPSAALAALQAVGARLDLERPEPYFKYAQNCKVSPIAGLARLSQGPELATVSIFFVFLLAVAGLVLLVACVNVASLLLARAVARRREIAVRVSLGASRGRLIQQMLVESSLLAVLGTSAGLALARITTSLVAAIPLPLPVPVRLVVEPDWRVALYAAVLAVFSTLACGLLPSLQSVRDSMTHDLQREPRQRLRRVLVIAQLAVSLVILVAGFLFLRNMLRAGLASPGFDTRNTLRAEVFLPPAAYADRALVAQFITRSLRELEALPGIDSAAAARIVPFTDAATRGGDITFTDSGEKVRMTTHWNLVTPAYFRVMDIPVLEGRTFLASEREEDHSVIVNREFVRRYLGPRPPVGATFLWGPESTIPHRIVGVVAGARNLTLGEGDLPQMYEPLKETGTRVQFILRSALPPAGQLTAVRQALRRLEPAAGVEVRTLLSAIGLAFLPSQVGAALMGAIGLLGLLLAAIGLYGTLVYSITRRKQELAVRTALGATHSDLRRMVFADSMRLIAYGSAIGLFIAFFVTRPLATFLIPGLKPADPVTFAAVTAVFFLVGLAAALDPARRAACLDAAAALRQG